MSPAPKGAGAKSSLQLWVCRFLMGQLATRGFGDPGDDASGRDRNRDRNKEQEENALPFSTLKDGRERYPLLILWML